MALSGSISTTVESHWKLSISWTATQDITNNKSTVTAKMYWESIDQYGAVNSTATKTSGIQHDDGTWSTESSAGMAGLSANEKKLINTYTFTLTHDSDGSKSFSLDGYFDAQVNLSGTYYDTINLTQKTFTLDDIPRETTLTSSASWTAGNSLSMSFDKASSSFTTNVTIKVNNVTIKTITGITGSSYTYNFTTDEVENILVELNKDTSSWNQLTSIDVTTYNGSTKIGSTQSKGGTCTAPTATTVAGSNFTIGKSTTITLSNEKNSNFVYDLTAKITTTEGSYTAPNILTKAGLTNPSWSTTGAVHDGLLGVMSAYNSGSVTYTLTTYWKNGTSYTKVRSATTATVTASVDKVAEAPTFTNAGISYVDSNGTITAITQDASYIVQGKSTLKVTVASTGLAQAKTGTSMSYYTFTFGSKTSSNVNHVAGSSAIYSFTASDSSTLTSNTTCYVKAVDKRGNSTTASITVKVLPYSIPVITATATRDDGFNDPVTITLSGSISSVNGKNTIKTMTYQYRVSKTGTYQVTPLNFTNANATLPSYKANSVKLATQMSALSAWDVYIVVTDAIGGTNNVTKIVPVGQPILFLDANKKAVGMSTLPSGNGTLEIGMGTSANTGIYLNGSSVQGKIWTGTGGVVLQSLGTYNLHLGQNNTSDMVFYPDRIEVSKKLELLTDLDMNNHNMWGLNALYFLDESTGAEGINFIKSTATQGSTNNADYDTFRVDDGSGYLNGNVIFTSDSVSLWTGDKLMHSTDTVTPTKKLSECPNGWVLVWSDADGSGTDPASATSNNGDWYYTHVPKDHPSWNVGGGLRAIVPIGPTTFATKYLYISDTTITGHVDNNDSPAYDVNLRKVISY